MSETEEKKPMMIATALKKLNIILERMDTNSTDIEKYSSQPSSERPYFETEAKQAAAVKSLMQANEDLRLRYHDLKNRVEYTNLMTIVTFEGAKLRLSEVLSLQRTLSKKMERTYTAMNDIQGQARLRQISHVTASGEKAPYVVRFYKEEEKRDKQNKWRVLMESININLEVVNATTPLLDFPPKS
jgi:hypothetical protein